MLMIRLARHGAKKKPFYHVVAIDKRRARNAICTEKLGFYNPMEKYAIINLERVKYWLSTGAQCSDSVAKLVSKYEQGQFQTPKSAKKIKAKVTATGKTKEQQPKAEKPSKASAEKAQAKADTKKKVTKTELPKKQEKTLDKKETAKQDKDKA